MLLSARQLRQVAGKTKVVCAPLGARAAHHAPQGTSFEPGAINMRLDLNPTVKKQRSVQVKSTTTTKAARKHWKRNSDARPSSGLLNNFADAKHTTLSEQARH